MTPVIEPGDEIQVFVKGTGCCLWGCVQVADEPGYLLRVTIEPLDDTIAQLREAGVEVPDHPVRGREVFVPEDKVDVVFGDDRHDEPDPVEAH